MTLLSAAPGSASHRGPAPAITRGRLGPCVATGYPPGKASCSRPRGAVGAGRGCCKGRARAGAHPGRDGIQVIVMVHLVADFIGLTDRPISRASPSGLAMAPSPCPRQLTSPASPTLASAWPHVEWPQPVAQQLVGGEFFGMAHQVVPAPPGNVGS